MKFGAAFTDAESVQRLDQSFGDDIITRSVSDNGTDIVWGLGFGVTMARVFHLRLGFESVGIDEDVATAGVRAVLSAANTLAG